MEYYTTMQKNTDLLMNMNVRILYAFVCLYKIVYVMCFHSSEILKQTILIHSVRNQTNGCLRELKT